MSKGFLYDNGDELITREAEASVSDAGKTLQVDENGNPGWADASKEIKFIYVIPSYSGGIRLTFYSKYSAGSGDKITVAELYELQNKYNLVYVCENATYPIKYIDKSTDKYNVYCTQFLMWLTVQNLLYVNSAASLNNVVGTSSTITLTNPTAYTLTPST